MPRHPHFATAAGQAEHDCLIFILNCYDVWSGPSRGARRCGGADGAVETVETEEPR
jgi:hypothetical protein